MPSRSAGSQRRQLGGPFVWSGNLNTHVSRAMGEMVAARDWLTVYQLSPYAHELNPVEPVGSHSSGPWPTWPNATSASSPRWSGPKRMQYLPGLLDGFLASTGLDLTPFCNPRN